MSDGTDCGAHGALLDATALTEVLVTVAQALRTASAQRQGATASKAPAPSASQRNTPAESSAPASDHSPRISRALTTPGVLHAPPGVSLRQLQAMLDQEGVTVVDLGWQVVQGARALKLRRPGVVLRNGVVRNKGSRVRSVLADGKTTHRTCSVLLCADGCRLERVRVTGCLGDNTVMGDSVLVYRARGCVLRECRVDLNGWCGVMVRGEGAVGHLQGGCVAHNGGSGVGCDNGAEIRVDGAVVERNGYNAVESHGRGCLAVVTDTVCCWNKHAGLAAINAAVIRGRHLLLRENSTGVRSRSKGSIVYLSDSSAVSSTKAAFHALEDGLVVLSGRVDHAGGQGPARRAETGGRVVGSASGLLGSETPLLPRLWPHRATLPHHFTRPHGSPALANDVAGLGATTPPRVDSWPGLCAGEYSATQGVAPGEVPAGGPGTHPAGVHLSSVYGVGLGLTPPLALGLSVGDASLYLDAMTPEGAGDEAGGMVLDAGGGPGGGDPESFESSAASTVSEGDGLEGMEV